MRSQIRSSYSNQANGKLGNIPSVLHGAGRNCALTHLHDSKADRYFGEAHAPTVYASSASPDSLFEKRAAIAARWMLGLPPVLFGLFNLVGIRVFASIVPQWMPFGKFWAVLTGIAFILAGIAICSGIKDFLALRLLALMLLLFEGLVEIPPFLSDCTIREHGVPLSTM